MGFTVTHNNELGRAEKACVYPERHNGKFVAFERENGRGNFVFNSCPSIDLVLLTAEAIRIGRAPSVVYRLALLADRVEA